VSATIVSKEELVTPREMAECWLGSTGETRMLKYYWTQLLNTQLELTIAVQPLPGLTVQGSGSISQGYGSGSGSGSFFHQAKKEKKPWFLLLCDFFLTFYLWKIM
jgi:hypothetical protein